MKPYEEALWNLMRKHLGSDYTRPILMPWLLWSGGLVGVIVLFLWLPS